MPRNLSIFRFQFSPPPARYYHSALSIWLSVDPMADKYPGVSPYAYCANNPVRLVDPNGREISPIYDLAGNFLGTDDQGLQGQLIMMKKEHFVQGMQHNDAVYQSAIDRADNPVSEAALFCAQVHQANLYKRPDWDGFVTREEGISWAKSHVNALKHPTPENTLYLDASKMDFGTLSIADFKNGVGQVSPVNLLTYSNSDAAMGNDVLFNTIYALGRVNMRLLDANGHVQIINDNATNYDWNIGGGVFRDRLIKTERFLNGLNDSHGFKVYYYGKGELNFN